MNSLRPSDAYMRQWNNHHWFRWWLVAWSAPSHYLNQCWIVVNWTLKNIFQWKSNQNTTIFIEENARQNVVCEMASILSRPQCVNIFWLWQIGHHYADDIFKCIFLNENVWIARKKSLNIFPEDPINNIQSLVQIMAWHLPCDRPLSETIMFGLLLHIYVSEPQWARVHLPEYTKPPRSHYIPLYIQSVTQSSFQQLLLEFLKSRNLVQFYVATIGIVQITTSNSVCHT